jgi:hypothetical protein
MGVKFIALLLLARVVGWTTGCGPKQGEIGGQCKSTGSCHAVCDEGVCDNASNTCVADVVDSGPAPTCDQTGSHLCDGGKTGFRCEPGITPSAYASNCSVVPDDNDDWTNYCCDDPTRGGCSTSDASTCPPAATSYECSGLSTPESDAAMAIGCFVESERASTTSYCCAPIDICFPASIDGGDERCSDLSTGLYCTGSASAPVGCWLQTAYSSPGEVSFYCCDIPDGGARDE